MYIFIAILVVIASILLTICVLLQNSKGGGLAANFAAGNQTFGVRQTADILEKATWTLAIIIILLCVAATAFVSDRSTGTSSVQERIENTQNVEMPDFQNIPAAQNQNAEVPAEQ